MKIIQITFLLLLFSLNAVASDLTASSHPAERVVQNTTDKVLSVLENQQDASQISQLINEIVLPHFNFEQMSKWALGKHWGELSKQKQILFVANFRQLLVNTYATALSEFNNESVEVKKAKTGKNAKIAMVPTVISLPNAKPLKISYMMMQSGSDWKVVDMSISGVSLIRNYRATYASEIRKQGFDALMEKIIEKNELAGL